MDYQKKILGIFFIICGAFQIIFITLIGTFLIVGSLQPDVLAEAEMPAMFKLISLAGSIMLFLLLSLPSVVVGIGLLRKKNWAEDLILPLGCFYLLFFPLGTAIGIYGLLVFFSNRKRNTLSHSQEVNMSPTVH